jgi:alkylation response protein AidB-like acyl-CoA dehydrogenase
MSATIPTPAEMIARAQSLVASLRERTQRCEELRRCPDETLEDYAASGILAICRPARFGGYELGWDVVCQVGQTLARGCAAQAWVANIFSDHNQLLANFEPRAQEDVWGANPNACICASIEPAGQARPVAGGVIFSGRHRYLSGIDHATWAICGGFLRADGRPPRRCFFLLPKAAGTVIDDWQVVGLSGTGSKSLELKEVFVPTHRVMDADAADGGTSPALDSQSAAVFRMPRMPIVATGFAALAVGVGDAMLEQYQAAMQTPRSSSTGFALPHMGTEMTAGVAAAELTAAGLAYLSPLRAALARVEQGEMPSIEERLRVRVNSAFAVQLALAAAQRLFNGAGGRVLFTSNPMQRQMRDLYAIAAHRALNWDAATAAYGSHFLSAPSR